MTTALIADGAQLRRATMRDLDAIVALQHAAYAPNRQVLGVEPQPLLVDYRQVLATKEVWCLDVGEALGAVLIVEPHTDHVLIWSISTAPAQQGKSLGGMLLKAAEIRARELGVRTLRLYTGTKLADRVAWYARHGYVTESVEQLNDRSLTHMFKVLGA